MTQPTFPLIDYHGHDWRQIRTYLENELDQLKKHICADRTHDETNKLRGHIQSIQTILGWEEKNTKARQSN